MDLGSDGVGNLITGAGVVISGVVMFLVWGTLRSQQKAVELQGKQADTAASVGAEQIALAIDSAKIANIPTLAESLRVNLRKASENAFVKEALGCEKDDSGNWVLGASMLSVIREKYQNGSMYFDTIKDLETSQFLFDFAFHECIGNLESECGRLRGLLEESELDVLNRRLCGIELGHVMSQEGKAKDLKGRVEDDLYLLRKVLNDQKTLYLNLSKKGK